MASRPHAVCTAFWTYIIPMTATRGMRVSFVLMGLFIVGVLLLFMSGFALPGFGEGALVGMRQRLKLGLALAGDSEVVLLDEPFLGVDPPSRKDLRDHVLALGRAGRTVLVSSHVLHEVEALTELVGIIDHGRLLGFGNVRTLVRKIRDDHPHRIVLHVDEPRKLGQALLGLSHIRELKMNGPQTLEFVTIEPESAYRELPKLVVELGVAVHRVDSPDHTLESVFARVTAVGSRRL